MATNGRFGRLVFVIALLTSAARAQVWTEYLGGRSLATILWDADRKLMWFATSNDGLISFDGSNFTDYNTITTRGKLITNNLTCAVLDKDGDVWLGTGTSTRALIRFKPDSGKWVNYTPAQGLLSSRINALAVDDSGAIWIGTNNGANRFDRRQRWDTLTVANGLCSNTVRAIAVDDSGKIWFGTAGKGACLRSPSGIWSNYLTGKTVNAIFVDRRPGKGDKWFAANDSVYRLLANNRDFDPRPTKSQPGLINPSTNVFNGIAVDDNDNKWIGINGGAVRIDLSEPDTLVWQIFTDATTLSNRTIGTITRDGDGNLWFGDQLSRGAVQMSANWLTYVQNDGLGSNVVNALAEDGAGNIWAGTRSGISKLNSTKWTNFRLLNTGGVSRAEITAIAIDSTTQTMWLGTFSGGVVRVPRGAKPNDPPPITTFYTVANTNNGLADNRIWDIALFCNEVWFATQGGVSLFLPDSNKWQKYTTANDLIDNDVRSIAIDKNGVVWCGTIGGISRFDRKSWQSFTTSNTDSLSGNFINDILIDNEAGVIWFATNGNGVSRYNQGRWRAPLFIKDGLADNRVNALFKTRNPAGIWFGTSNGASFRSATGTWTTVKKQHGLGENHVKSLLEDRRHRIWFGSLLRGATRYTRTRNRPAIQLLNRFDVTTSAEILYNFVGSDLATATPFLRYAFALDNSSQYSPWTFDTFARIVIPNDGMHTFYVKTIDTDGNESAPATDTFYKISPEKGGSTALTDSAGFGNLRPIGVTLYWPPNQLPDTFQAEIEPVSPASLQSPAFFAYAFKPFTADISKKGVILGYEFPPPSTNPNVQYAIYRDVDAQGRRDSTILGGTQRKLGGRIQITTAIDQFGIYAVRLADGPGVLASARVTAQPRIFSPNGGGHGPQTTISFKLDRDAPVRLQVYNLAGRLVKTICNEPMRAGVNAVPWDGRDKNGEVCPTGLYIVTIESSGFQAPLKTVKVMVMN